MAQKKKRSRRPARRRAKATTRERTRSNPIKRGRHRATLVYKGGKWYRPKYRSGRNKGEISSKLIEEPTRINPRRKKSRKKTTKRRRYTRRSNPRFTLKRVFSQRNLMRFVSVGAGMVGGAMTMPILSHFVPRDMQGREGKDNLLGAYNVGLGLLIVATTRRGMFQTVGYSIGAMGIYDLIASNVPGMEPMVLPRSVPLVTDMLPEEKLVTDRLPEEKPESTGVSFPSGQYGRIGTSFPSGQHGRIGASYEASPQNLVAGSYGIENNSLVAADYENSPLALEGIDW